MAKIYSFQSEEGLSVARPSERQLPLPAPHTQPPMATSSTPEYKRVYPKEFKLRHNGVQHPFPDQAGLSVQPDIPSSSSAAGMTERRQGKRPRATPAARYDTTPQKHTPSPSYHIDRSSSPDFNAFRRLDASTNLRRAQNTSTTLQSIPRTSSSSAPTAAPGRHLSIFEELVTKDRYVATPPSTTGGPGLDVDTSAKLVPRPRPYLDMRLQPSSQSKRHSVHRKPPSRFEPDSKPDSGDEMDALPTIRQMLAKTRPSYPFDYLQTREPLSASASQPAPTTSSAKPDAPVFASQVPRIDLLPAVETRPLSQQPSQTSVSASIASGTVITAADAKDNTIVNSTKKERQILVKAGTVSRRISTRIANKTKSSPSLTPTPSSSTVKPNMDATSSSTATGTSLPAASARRAIVNPKKAGIQDNSNSQISLRRGRSRTTGIASTPKAISATPSKLRDEITSTVAQDQSVDVAPLATSSVEATAADLPAGGMIASTSASTMANQLSAAMKITEPLPQSEASGSGQSAVTPRSATHVIDVDMVPPHPSPRTRPKPRTANANSAGSDVQIIYAGPSLVGSPAKRRRTDDDDNAAVPHKRTKSHQKHPKHWLLDGNIIIELNDIRFKLHRSRLSEQSAHFAQIFDDESAVDSLVDGYPVYNLDKSGISVQDFVSLLDAMNDAVSYILQPPPFLTVISILRASMTLKFPAFQKWTTAYIERIWSPNLQEISSHVIPYALETVVLARRYGLDAVLKRALYELVRSPGFHPVTLVPDANENAHNSREATLSLLDFQMLLEVREQFTEAWLHVANFTSHRGDNALKCPLDATVSMRNGLPYGPCLYSVHNTSHAKYLHDQIVDLSGPINRKWMYDPVVGINAIIDALKGVRERGGRDGCCEECKGWFQQQYNDLQTKLWHDLDGWFRL